VFQYISFFFSSRRRHTRFSRDWSSDVCSSDLKVGRTSPLTDEKVQLGKMQRKAFFRFLKRFQIIWSTGQNIAALGRFGILQSGRSEERRVGKECRSRWAPERQKKRKTHEARDG